MQRALIQYRDPRNYELVYKALKAARREDLIGFDDRCLIKPPRNGAQRDRRPGSAGQGTKERQTKAGSGRTASRSRKR